MDTKVTSLFGAPLPNALESDPRLVQELERILEDARSGKVVAVAAALQLHDGEATMLVKGRSKPFVLLGVLEAVKSIVLQQGLRPRAEWNDPDFAQLMRLK